MRIGFVRLVDQAQTLPFNGRLFRAEGERVDLDDSFVINLLADGSLEQADEPAPAATPAAAPIAAEPAA